jgi:hypothetical protein
MQMKIKRYNQLNEGIRSQMTPKHIDIEHSIDRCFLKGEGKGMEQSNEKIIYNMSDLLFNYLGYARLSSTKLIDVVLEEIPKDILKAAMLKVAKEIIAKDDKEVQ